MEQIERCFPASDHYPKCEVWGWQHDALGFFGGDYEDILRDYLKTSAKKLKLGLKWVFKKVIGHKLTSRLITKYLNDNKSKVLK